MKHFGGHLDARWQTVCDYELAPARLSIVHKNLPIRIARRLLFQCCDWYVKLCVCFRALVLISGEILLNVCNVSGPVASDDVRMRNLF